MLEAEVESGVLSASGANLTRNAGVTFFLAKLDFVIGKKPQSRTKPKNSLHRKVNKINCSYLRS